MSRYSADEDVPYSTFAYNTMIHYDDTFDSSLQLVKLLVIQDAVQDSTMTCFKWNQKVSNENRN